MQPNEGISGKLLKPSLLEHAQQLLELAKTSEFHRWRLEYGTFVSRDWNYMFFETPKCACTSTKVTLWNLDGRPLRLPWPRSVHDRMQSDGRISKADLDTEEALYYLISDRVVRFYVYRDPVQRLLSAFQNKILFNEDPAVRHFQGFKNVRKILMKTYALRTEAEINFRHFAEFVCNTPDASRDAHWMSQSRLILAEFIGYNYVVDLSRYEEGMQHVFAAIGAPASFNDDFSIRLTEGQRLPHVMSEAERELIQRSYASDYALAPHPTRQAAGQ